MAVTQFSDKVRVRRLSFAGHSFKSENQAVSQVILTLNQSSSSSRWQVASTRDRHCCCSAARLAMVSHVTLNHVIYFSTLRLPGEPVSVRRKAHVGSTQWNVRYTCVSHLHIRILVFVVTDGESILRSSFSLMIVLG